MTKILTIANHKGGVGKTTSVSSLGVALARRGKKVLLVDLDSQSNLTTIILPKDRTPERTLWEAMIEGRDIPIEQISKKLSLVPSSVNLSQLDRALDKLLDDTRSEVNRLSRLLAPISEDYDYILLDCPPSLGLATLNALVASTGVLIVMTAESLPSMGMKALSEVISKIGQNYNKGLRLSGIILTRYQRRRISRLIENNLRQVFGDLVFEAKIREDIKLVESPLYHKHIFDYDPTSNGARDYEDLADEMIKKNI